MYETEVSRHAVIASPNSQKTMITKNGCVSYITACRKTETPSSNGALTCYQKCRWGHPVGPHPELRQQIFSLEPPKNTALRPLPSPSSLHWVVLSINSIRGKTLGHLGISFKISVPKESVLKIWKSKWWFKVKIEKLKYYFLKNTNLWFNFG